MMSSDEISRREKQEQGCVGCTTSGSSLAVNVDRGGGGGHNDAADENSVCSNGGADAVDPAIISQPHHSRRKRRRMLVLAAVVTSVAAAVLIAVVSKLSYNNYRRRHDGRDDFGWKEGGSNKTTNVAFIGVSLCRAETVAGIFAVDVTLICAKISNLNFPSCQT